MSRLSVAFADVDRGMVAELSIVLLDVADRNFTSVVSRIGKRCMKFFAVS